MPDPRAERDPRPRRATGPGWGWRFRGRRDRPAPEPPPRELRFLLERFESRTGGITLSLGPQRAAGAEEASPLEGTARLAAGLIQAALQAGAGELHFEPGARSIRIRLRIDGVLHEEMQLPAVLHQSLAAVLKEAAGMDTSRDGLPQEGLLLACWEDRDYRLRASCLPGAHGEGLVFHVPALSLFLGLNRLGFFPDTLAGLERLATRPAGLLLVGGPRDGGRTTTLYSVLNRLNSVARSLSTVEAPVEFLVPGVTQVSVNPAAELTFAAAIDACVRHSVEVLMVGALEERAAVTAALQAARGRLVLAAMDADSAAAVLPGLVAAGAAPFHVAQGITGVLVQRLARRLCEECARPAGEQPGFPAALYTLRAEVLKGEYPYLPGYADARPEEPPDPGSLFRVARGCEKCRQTGYRGRIGLFELLEVTPEIRSALLRGAPPDEIEQLALRQGMKTLAADGLRKAAAGVTSVEEVVRVLGL